MGQNSDFWSNAFVPKAENFRDFIEKSPDGVLILNHQGLIVYANPTAEDLFGCSPGELVGRPYGFPITGEKKTEVELIRKKSDPLHAEMRMSEMGLGDDTVYLVAVRDVTDRKLIENRLQHLNRTFLSLGADFETNIQLLTRSCLELLNADASFYNRITGSTITSMACWGTPPGYHLEDRAEGHICTEVVRRGREGGLFVLSDVPESPFGKSDPDIVQFGIQTYIGFPVTRHGRAIGSLCAVFKKPVQFEESQERILEILAAAVSIEEERIWNREELRLARDRAEEASRIKGEFLTNVSHEIRTPLNGILGMSELLGETSLNAQQTEYLSLIQSSAGVLLDLVNGILDLSRIEKGKLELVKQSFNLKAALEEITTLFRLKAQQKGLIFNQTFSSDVPERIIGDQLRLKQILNNLLENAVKFTDEGFVSFLVEPVERKDRQIVLRFSVIDSGIGIPSDKFDRLFKSFSQVDGSLTRRFGGTGLGLAISWQLADLMRGSIEVSSQEGTGSTFTAFLPFQIDQPSAEETAPPHNSGDAGLTFPKTLRILVAEDNPVNQRLAAALLKKMGWEAVTAVDGDEVLEKYEKESFDLILMDVQMPHTDGMEATRQIRNRERERGGHLPIIAMTAYAMSGDREKCLEAGMDGYLSKPIKSRKLYQLIQQVLTQQSKAQNQSSENPSAGDSYGKRKSSVF